MKKPKKNIITKKSALFMVYTLKVNTKLIAIETMTAIIATGERLPYIKSERYPRAILPTIAPMSNKVEILATS
jgi:hypothetical protein